MGHTTQCAHALAAHNARYSVLSMYYIYMYIAEYNTSYTFTSYYILKVDNEYYINEVRKYIPTCSYREHLNHLNEG